MGAVAEAMLERFQDEIALDLGHGAADQVAGDLLGGHGSLRPLGEFSHQAVDVLARCIFLGFFGVS